MWSKRKRSRPLAPGEREAALAMRPVKNVEMTEEDHGETLRLVYMVQMRPWFAGAAQRVGLWDGRPMQKTLELDGMGRAAWELMDGERTVGELATAFEERYGITRREAEMAMTAFIRELGRRGLIALR